MPRALDQRIEKPFTAACASGPDFRDIGEVRIKRQEMLRDAVNKIMPFEFRMLFAVDKSYGFKPPYSKTNLTHMADDYTKRMIAYMDKRDERQALTQQEANFLKNDIGGALDKLIARTQQDIKQENKPLTDEQFEGEARFYAGKSEYASVNENDLEDAQIEMVQRKMLIESKLKFLKQVRSALTQQRELE